MGKVINIQPTTRIEGHSKISIMLDDSGNVEDTRFSVIHLRGFEKFAQGRPVEEMPRIVNRICGICPWNHMMSSAKATDQCFGVEVPSAGKKLREFCQHLSWINDKILHFFFLAAPDFVIGPDADYAARNVIGIVGAAPDIAKQVVHMRYMTSMLLEKFAGKVIHPVVAVPGGFSKPMLESERDEMRKGITEAFEFVKFAMTFAKENVFAKYLDVIKELGVIETGFLGMIGEDGSHQIYDGKLRMMKADGSTEDFALSQYADYIGEHSEPWAYVKFPYAKKWGEFSLDLDNHPSVYRVNTLARVNVCDKFNTPLAQQELQEFREQFGRPAQATLLYHYARLIELINNCERCLELLDDPEITSKDVRTPVKPQAGHGIGIVEAPRGTLIHDYECDDQGFVTKANIIPGTTHNIAPINLSVKQAAKSQIKDGKYDEGVLNKVEMAIRAYDP
jgi:F420-non-reducing hydrogenase large subunit